MFIENINISNFRNIDSLSLLCKNPITILYGENGQGKTNIVESIYVLANATSFRTTNFKEMIKVNENFSNIEGIFRNNKKSSKFKISLKQNGKVAFINDLMITKFSDYIGKVNAICFSPEDVSIFKDFPGDRRQFLDKELSSLFPIYIKQLIAFRKILEERNNLLKQEIDYDLLDVIDDKLIESSYDVYKRRKWLILKIIEFASIIYQKITNKNQTIRIEYHTFLDEPDKEKYYQKAKEIYKNNLKKDVEKMHTNIGIHKDDFKVFLNELEIDMYASQGQQRLISLCMKLAVSDIIEKASNEQPIIILDDAFSELDLFKKNKLFEYILNKNQVFITCTDYKNIINEKTNKNVTLLHIKEGKILERRSI